MLQLRAGNQEEEAFSMKDMEVGRRLRVSLTEVRMYLVVLENSQSICEERRGASPTSFLSNDTISPFPLCSTIAIRMQSVSRIDPIPPQIMKARAAVLHRVARKLRARPAQAAPSDTQARKVHSPPFSYQSSLSSMHRRAMGRGQGRRGRKEGCSATP